MSPPKSKIKRKPLVLDGNGHFEDIYQDKDGFT